MNDEQLLDLFDNLTGLKRHYCFDWDFLPIDETCPEFESCSCTFSNEENKDG